MSIPSKRQETDIMKLIRNGHKVEMINDNMKWFYVHFYGPKDSLYEGGAWKLSVELPYEYPKEPPVINFINKIFHPNIDDYMGVVCLDVLDQNWNHHFDLVLLFEMFLPQLLQNPNESDPLNEVAAALMIQDIAAYKLRVKEYCEKYANPANIEYAAAMESSDEETTSDEDENDSNDEQVVDKPDP